MVERMDFRCLSNDEVLTELFSTKFITNTSKLFGLVLTISESTIEFFS
jgi:hypothetical protein